MKRILIATIAITSLLSACSGNANDPDKKMSEEPGATLNGPRKGVFLRASFDDDPSHFVGRFLSNELVEDQIDENRGIQTECTKFVTYKEVNASGSFDEYYNSSTEVKGNFGLTEAGEVMAKKAGVGGDASMGHSSGTTIRVKYDLTKKIVANVSDPAAFKACCDSSPDACTDRYVGEFWYGTGTLYEKSGRQTGGQANLDTTATASSLSVADGWAWKRSTDFKDVYFAFRVTDRVAQSNCDWANRPPKSSEGQYFVGVSPASPSEDIARSAAMRNARVQAVQYLGETIAASSSSSSSVIDGYAKSESVVNTVAEGIANFVKDDRYCPAEMIDSPKGPTYVMKVLAFFPNEKKKEAVKTTIDNIESKAKADGKLTPILKNEIKALRLKNNE